MKENSLLPGQLLFNKSTSLMPKSGGVYFFIIANSPQLVWFRCSFEVASTKLIYRKFDSVARQIFNSITDRFI